jgi:RNA polymerase sigma-70 factor (ECF subfamily)
VRLSYASRPPAALEDAELVRAALAGDGRASRIIWRRYLPLVRSRLGRALGSHDVDDHVQEVFLRLFEYLAELRDPTALRSFLIGITLRIAGTEMRRRRSRGWLTLTATGELPEPRENNDFADDGETRQIAEKLRAVLGKLNDQSYRFFELRFMEERELVEVAEAMNVSLATAKRHLARVVTRVQAMAEREPVLAECRGAWSAGAGALSST